MGEVLVRTLNTNRFARLMIIAGVNSNTNSPPRIFGSTPKNLYDYDHFFWPLVCNQWTFVSRPMSAGEIFGYPDEYKQLGRQSIRSGWLVEPKYDARDDWGRFGAYASGLPMLLRVLAGAKTFSFQPGRNKQVKHLALRGQFGPVTDPPSFYTWWSDGPGAGYLQNLYSSFRLPQSVKPSPVLALPGWQKQAFSVNLPLGATFTGGIPTVVGSWGTYPNAVGGRRIEEFLPMISGDTPDDPVTFVEYLYEVLSGGAIRNYSVATTVISCSFDHIDDDDFPTFKAEWVTTIGKTSGAGEDSQFGLSSSIEIRPSMPAYSTNVVPTGYKALPRVPQVRYRYSNSLLYASGAALTEFTNRGRAVGSTEKSEFNSTPTSLLPCKLYLESNFQSSPKTGTVLASTVQTLEREWASALASEWPDIEAAVWYSSMPAVDEAMNAVSTSQLQSVAKIGQVLDSAKVFTEYWRILQGVKKGEINTLYELVKWVSDTKLTADFQYRPMVDFIVNFLPEWWEVFQALSARGTSLTGKGQFRYTYPQGTFGREEVNLLVKTTLRVEWSGSSFVKRILGAKALSLYPSPKLAYDLYQFSFIANYCYNLGARMAAMETAAAGALLNVQSCVHVLELSSPLEPRDYARLNATHDSTAVRNSDQFRYVRRYNSQYVPAPRQSKYDYGGNSGDVNWGIFIALATSLTL